MKTPSEMGKEWTAQKEMEERRARRAALLAASKVSPDPKRYSENYQTTN